MALMFRRIARNFAKNGYFPTDEVTLERIIGALSPSSGPMSVLDPCAGEGFAIAEVAHALGPEEVRAFAVEYNGERAAHARLLVDRCLHADLMQTFISRRSVGLLWLNPPYGDLVREGAQAHGLRGRARLEKLFYDRTVPLLQYEGILVFIIPHHILDAELVGWLTRHFGTLRVYRACDPQFKQVVVLGRRLPRDEQDLGQLRAARSLLLEVGRNDQYVPELPSSWTADPYVVPSSPNEPEHFYQSVLEPQQLSAEIDRLQGLWAEFDAHLGASQRPVRRPARALSRWHLALALAAGAISGVIRSRRGRTLIVKGHTHKEKSLRSEFTENEDGSVSETRILTDRFVSTIYAWDVTPESPTQGSLLTIR